jgi:hypothetical protein
MTPTAKHFAFSGGSASDAPEPRGERGDDMGEMAACAPLVFVGVVPNVDRAEEDGGEPFAFVPA